MEAVGVVGALDDHEPQPLAGRGTPGDRALIPSIGEQLLQPGETPSDACAGQVALAAIDLLAGIEPVRAAALGGLDRLAADDPAVGDASWPACSRAAMSRVAWIVDQIPAYQNRRK